MNLNSIRKSLFTNRLVEGVFISCLKAKVFKNVVNKLVAGNDAYSRHTIRTVERNGIRYSLDISDYQAWLIYYMSENDNSLELLGYLGDAKVIFDIGGNIGQTSLAINKNRRQYFEDHRIISFEPYPDTYANFMTNLELNPDTESITVENIGLGEIETEVAMFQDCATNSGGNRVVYDSSENTAGLKKVKIMTLDHYVKSNHLEKVDFIKIDIEGYEYAALKGAEKTLQKYKPKLFIELDNHNLEKQGSSSAALIAYLKGFKYSITDVNGKYAEEELISAEVHTDIFCE